MNEFINNLQILDMEPGKSGLLLVSDKENPNITETERRILNIAEKDFKADAVYFRKSENNLTSVPQLFIYDNTNNHISDETKKIIHKRIWSSEIVPIYYIFEKTQLLVVNGKQKISFSDKEENFENTISEHIDFLQLVEENYDSKKHPYKSYFFDNASFWDTDIYKNQYITKDSPFQLLIDYLKELKKGIGKKVTSHVLNRLIILCILIKYLEEKRDENGNNVFTVKSNILRDNWGAETFVDVIQKGKILNLFDYLAGYYNGEVFKWKDEKEQDKKDRNEVLTLSQEVLDYFAAYFDGHLNFKTNNFALWRFYSFQYLPIEFISRIYEEFLPDMPGVVYTPPFLVDFLVDECMPIEDYIKFKSGKFKILDPSLGSGIFCVSTYKRLIDWYKINRYHDEGKSWNEPVESNTLKRILKENIFGTDIENEAVRIAIFSLSLALIENLTPIQILEDLKFDDLSKENIQHENFFNFFNRHKDNPDFDLIIGNPPFNPPRGLSNGAYLESLKEDYQIEVSHKIPDDNLALIFLDRAALLSKPNGEGLTCLILPSAPLLYGKWSMDYRTHFLQQFNVPQIVDFTHLRRILFKNNDTPTVAIFVKNQKPDIKDKIWHIIASRTLKEQNRLFFLFDHYDFHIINYQRALNEKYIWKANLVGGGRLGRIVDRLVKTEQTVLQFLNHKEINNNWSYADGYIIGTNNRNNTAQYITNSYTLPNEAFSINGINYEKIYQEKAILFNNKSKENVFKKPQILIKRILSDNANIPINETDFNEVEKNMLIKLPKNKNSLCFKDGILGIHYPDTIEDKYEIELFKTRLAKKENVFIIYLTSSAVLIRKESALKKIDIDNLPYPENESELELSEIETIWRDDVLNYYKHQARSHEHNPLNQNMKDVKKQLFEYGSIFCKVMDASYKLKPDWSFKQGESFETSSYIATCFHYTAENIEYKFQKIKDKEFKDYFTKQTGHNQIIHRIIKYYDGDKIWFIKPLQMRYWLKSIADRDAFECINDILYKKK